MPKVIRNDNLYSDKCNRYLHKNLNSYFDNDVSFVNILKSDKRYSDLDQDIYELEQLRKNRQNIDGENCINCYHSDGKYCWLKHMAIIKGTPVCWSYRDCLTMRTASDFQDDNEDFYKYDEY